MKNQTKFLCLLLIAATLSSCVGKKKFLSLTDKQQKTELSLQEALDRLKDCNNNLAKANQNANDWKQKANLKDSNISSKDNILAEKDNQIADLRAQIKDLKGTNKNLLDRMSDLSVVSRTGAESIQKSLESINQQGKYIQSLTSKIQAKDSTNLVLVMNLKRSLADVNDEDIQIDVRGGVVYVSISDKLLFRSGSHNITSRAETVLGKVASVVNDHDNLDIMVEGHTDNVPISNSCVSDNWDLSVKRATSVVRVLQKKYNVAPERITAAGRSEYVPKIDNQTSLSRASNRRTEIILTPKLDEYFRLLEAPPGAAAGK